MNQDFIVLQFFLNNLKKPLTSHYISIQTQLPNPTVRRIVRDFYQKGVLLRNNMPRRYSQPEYYITTESSQIIISNLIKEREYQQNAIIELENNVEINEIA